MASHLLGAVEAVVAHAGEHDEQQAVADRRGGVGDREVGARAQAADRGVVGEARVGRSALRRRCGRRGRAARRRARATRRPRPRGRSARLARSRRAASEAVKPGGMCWTISVPAPSGEGSAGISSASARGPPVEEAMTQRAARRRADRGARDRRARRRWRGAGAGAAPWPSRPRRAERRWPPRRRSWRRQDLVAELCDERVERSPAGGLATSSNAPSASASTARAPWAGRRRRRRRPGWPGRRAAQRPQHADAVQARHGQVERHRVGRLALAEGERLVAVLGGTDDVDARPWSRTSATIRRISAQSSATTTRGLVVVVMEPLSGSAGCGGSGRDRQLRGRVEDRARSEQHDQALVDLGRSPRSSSSRRRAPPRSARRRR